MSRNIYLAGPFFNAAELATIERIEQMMEGRPDVRYFSPRKHGGNAERQSDVKQNAQAIFNANVAAMRECHECIAVLDRPQWMNPTGERVAGLIGPKEDVRTVRREIWLVHHVSYYSADRADDFYPIKGPLEQPDLGTVWELGYLRAWRDLIFDLDTDIEIPSLWAGRKILAGFTTKSREEQVGKQNVMLARCLDIMIHGFAELEQWMAHPSAGMALASFRAAGLDRTEGEVE
jgi:nucleoside 2-deoxyribosyltransferase